MNLRQTKLLQELREAREQLLNINFAADTPTTTTLGSSRPFSLVEEWRIKWSPTLIKLTSPDYGGWYIQLPLQNHLIGYHNEEDPEIFNELRPALVDLLDTALVRVDQTNVVKPVLEEYIARVKDTKLAQLLKEFNIAKDTAPNFTAMGFRTIVSLIIQEKAKRVSPGSKTATRLDLAPIPMIDSARNEKILSPDELRLLESFVSTHKDIYDFVSHRPTRLIDKNEIDTMIDLLNKFLPSIIN